MSHVLIVKKWAKSTSCNARYLLKLIIVNNETFVLLRRYNCILYENIDQILPNKSHEPMHYKIGVTCLYNGHVFYTHVITSCWRSLIQLFHNSSVRVMNSRVSGQCLYTILSIYLPIMSNPFWGPRHNTQPRPFYF